jgi:hypothetical protein
MSQIALSSERQRTERHRDSCKSRGDQDGDTDGGQTAANKGCSSRSSYRTATTTASVPPPVPRSVSDYAVDTVLVWTESPSLPSSPFLLLLSSVLREGLDADADARGSLKRGGGVGVGCGTGTSSDSNRNSDSSSMGGRGSAITPAPTATATAGGLSGDPGLSVSVPVPVWRMSAVSSLSDGCAVLSQALHASISRSPCTSTSTGTAHTTQASERDTLTHTDTPSPSLSLSSTALEPSVLSPLPLSLPFDTVTSIRVFDRPCPSFPPSLPFGVCIRRVTYRAQGEESRGTERDAVYGLWRLSAELDQHDRGRGRDKGSGISAVHGVEESSVVWLNLCTSSSSLTTSIPPQTGRKRNTDGGRDGGRDRNNISFILNVLPSTSIPTSAEDGEVDPIPGQTLDRAILAAAVHLLSPVLSPTTTAAGDGDGDGDTSTANVTAGCGEAKRRAAEGEDEDKDEDGSEKEGKRLGPVTSAYVSLGEKIGICTLSSTSSYTSAVPLSPSHPPLWEICIMQREEPEPKQTLDLDLVMDRLDGDTVIEEEKKERDEIREGERVEEISTRERKRERMRILCSIPFDPHTVSTSPSVPSTYLLTLHIGGEEGGPGLLRVEVTPLQPSENESCSTAFTSGGAGTVTCAVAARGEGDRDRDSDRLFVSWSERREGAEESDGEGKERKGNKQRKRMRVAALFLLCARLALKGFMYALIVYELAVGCSHLVGMRRGEELRWLERGMDRGMERGMDGTLVVRDRAKECLPFPFPVLSPFSSLLHRVTSLLPSKVNTHKEIYRDSNSNKDSNRGSNSNRETENAGTCDILSPRCTEGKEGGDKGGTGLGTETAVSVGDVCVRVPLSQKKSPRWALLAAPTVLTRLREGVGERVRGITDGMGERAKRVMGPLSRAAERWKLKLRRGAKHRKG